MIPDFFPKKTNDGIKKSITKKNSRGIPTQAKRIIDKAMDESSGENLQFEIDDFIRKEFKRQNTLAGNTSQDEAFDATAETSPQKHCIQSFDGSKIRVYHQRNTIGC